MARKVAGTLRALIGIGFLVSNCFVEVSEAPFLSVVVLVAKPHQKFVLCERHF